MAGTSGRSGLALRIGMVVAAALVALVLLPRLFAPTPAPPPVLHGRQVDGAIAYRDIPVADVLADIERLTGFRVLAFPQVGGRRYTGELKIGADGERAAATLAVETGLELRKAGPHWVLVDSAGK